MLICRFQGVDGPQYGCIQHDTVFALNGSPLSAQRRQGNEIGNIGQLTLLPPIVPTKIICVGRNYAAHAQELGNEIPEEPLLFFKPPSSLIGAGTPIEILPTMGRVDHEAELAIVIGKQGRFIPISTALDYVLGYCSAND